MQTNLRRKLLCLAGFAAGGLLSGHAMAALLSPQEAFQISAKRTGARTFDVTFRMRSGYHLYRDRIEVSTDDANIKVLALTLPAAKQAFDKALGENVFFYVTEVTAKVEVAAFSSPLKLTVRGQGCASAAGVCYPPVVQTFAVPVMEGSAS